MRILILISCLLATCTAWSPSILPVTTFQPKSRLSGKFVPSVQKMPLSICMAAKKTFKSMDDMLQNSDLPVLVDFYATWCGPCVLMSRELAEVGADPDLKERLMIVKIDTDKYPAIATKYQISALPTCVLFKGGAAVERFEGVLRAAEIKQVLLKSL